MSRRLKIVCAALDAKPLFWTEKNGSRYGFEPDVAQLVFAEAGLDFDWVFLPWSDFLPSVADGRMDGVWCGQGIIPERLKVLDFTDPYAIFNESVIMRAGEAVPTHEGLAGQRVGAIANSASMRLAKTFDDAILVAFDGDSDDVFGDMVGALRADEIDAVVDDDVALIPIAETLGIDMAFTVETRNPWGMGVRKGNDELRETINAAIAPIKIDGRLESTWTKWMPKLQYPF
jgi:polar amino acid transport system substrate-binding protein